ncbi:glycerate kinase [Rhodococcus jostii]|uniref:glycerate kinase n=1 Tax=Rhodococcus jostii TaxID=132919 RepID=UPI003625D26F
MTSPDAGPMRVAVAPDSFKGSLTATEVAVALAAGWSTVRPADELVLLPQADGGEGTVDAVASCHDTGVWRELQGVRGPDGRPATGRWLLLRDGTAVIELAQMSGLPLMDSPDPGGASTTGLGQVIAAALADGAKALLIGLGGSASTDGGAGALRALGAKLLDRDGREIPDGGAGLAALASIDVGSLIEPPPDGVELLTDTTAVLCGPQGAAHVFGPQKGADPAERGRLDRALATFAACLGNRLPCSPDEPGAGAAGGTGFGLSAWGGRLVPGAVRIAELTGLSAEFDRVDVVVTGEGQFDATSLSGKLVGSVLERCADTAIRSVVVAGRLAASPPGIGISLSDLAGSSEAALAAPTMWCRVAGAVAAARLTSIL